MRNLLLAMALILSGLSHAEQPLPENDNLIHHGVATCATSVCHGKASPEEDGNVRLNEYHTWLKEDLHSRAYKVLLNAQSQRIANNLGLPNARSAKICLDCHSDNVAARFRGTKFQITDGVGCEGCHGGSEKWLKSHTGKDATHRDNLSRGMYPTEDPRARARLCLSCHLGTREKFAGHDIMAAGHPRLVFELETFTANQPAHYDRDTDYRQRKGSVPGVKQWAMGLSVTATSQVELMQEKLSASPGLFPELAFFECHACHHPMDESRWRPLPLEKGVKPGDVRLNDSALDMLHLVLGIIDNEQSGALKQTLRALHLTVSNDKQAFERTLAELKTLLAKIERSVSGWRYDDSDLIELRKALINNMGRGYYRDYTSAEQAFLAVETLSLELGDIARYNKQLDKLYGLLSDEDRFEPDSFAAAARNYGL